MVLARCEWRLIRLSQPFLYWTFDLRKHYLSQVSQRDPGKGVVCPYLRRRSAALCHGDQLCCTQFAALRAELS